MYESGFMPNSSVRICCNDILGVLSNADRVWIDEWRPSGITATIALIFGSVTTIFSFPPQSCNSTDSQPLSNALYHYWIWNHVKCSPRIPPTITQLFLFSFCLNVHKISWDSPVLLTRLMVFSLWQCTIWCNAFFRAHSFHFFDSTCRWHLFTFVFIAMLVRLYSPPFPLVARHVY